MTEFALVVGLIIGAAIGGAIGLFFGSDIRKLLGLGDQSSPSPPAAPSPPSPPTSIVQLAPCADVAEGPPAVNVMDLPDSVMTADDVARNPAIVQRIKHPDTARLVWAIAQWRPKRHRSEARFQQSLEKFLSVENTGIPDFLTMFQRGLLVRHSTERFPHGRVARPDFVYNKSVLLELKKGLTASGETDRALGQLLRYLWLWRGRGAAVLVICGDYDQHLKNLAKNYVDGWRAQGLPVMAFFVRDNGQDATDEVPEVDAPT